MKSTTLDLAAPATTFATCWHIARQDGAGYRYTDHDQPIEVSGQGAPLDGEYITAVGYTAGVLENRGDLAVDQINVGATLTDENLIEADIRSGLFDFATVYLFLIDWKDPGGGILKLRRGTFGEVALREGRFRVELRGLAQALQQTVGESFTPSCRANLGDARCTVSMAAITVSGTVTATASREAFVDGARGEADGFFDNGVVLFTSGQNAGVSREVRAYTGGAFYLQHGFPWPIQVGDGYDATPGCQKTLSDCRDRYDNVLNFRGEPYVPGADETFRTPNAG